jgi:PAS domain S-box-containing protein
MFAAAFILAVFTVCEKSSKEQPDAAAENRSFRDIPGVTRDEINAIEALQKEYGSFVYGMSPSTEAFIGKNGQINGYSAFLCGWLTEMFGIPFRIELYEWDDLIRGLQSGGVDFTCELMPTPERRKTYFMTSPIIERSIKIYRLRDGETLDRIMKSRQLRYAFLEGSVLSVDVSENAVYEFETVFIDGYHTAYRMLKNNEIDAYFGLDTSEAAFDEYGDVVAEEYYPLIFKSTCLSAHRAELQPVINIVEKALDEQTLSYLAVLYKEGHQRYLENKLYNMLTKEEKTYIQNNPVIPVAAESTNYPICFFDTNTNKWHGIYFDTLEEITKLTGLAFQRLNEHGEQDRDLIDMLENGEVLIMPELYRLKEYQGRFLWSGIPLLEDTFAFLSKSDYKNIEGSQIPYLKIGVRKNSVYSEFLKKMFPVHRHLTEYDSQEDVWSALQRDEVEVIFACNRRLTTYTNFYEDAGYKLNWILNYSFDSSLGYNKDALLLKSIVDKCLSIININNISNQWMLKTYDYRYRLSQAQRPWYIGLSIMFFTILVLVSIFLIKSRSSGKQLETLVKQRTGELAYQSSLLNTIVDSLPDGVFCKDVNLKYTLCNKYMAELFGKKLEDILGKDDINAIGMSAEAMAFANDVDRRVMKEHTQIAFEEWLPCADGVTRLFETVKVPLVLDGKITGILGIGRDITQRKEIERELAFKTSQLQITIASIPDIMFCKDINFRYTQCNKNFEEFHDIREADILGKTDKEITLFTPEDAEEINKIERTVMEEDRVFLSEENITSPVNGKKTVFETVKAPIKQGGAVVGMIAIIRDITQRKAMEDEVRAASSAKTSFLANMSHEIRTPLNVIIGLTDLVLEDDSLERHVTENLAKISNAGTTLLSIVNDILDFSKIESGKLELTPVEYYMSSLLNDVVTLVVTRLGEKPITFSLDITDDLPAKLYGDDLRVKQIFTNLLTNAIKYTRQGSIELNVRCTREGGLAGDTVWMDVAVSDTGMGIRVEDLKKLFSDYNQVDTKANRNIEGTGLGLSITKRLAEMMDGKISAESEYGKGTTFRLRLKQCFVSDAPIGANTADKLRSFRYIDDKRIVTKKLVRVNLSYAKVLVVDDMQTNLDVASGLLRKYKMQVDCLGSGQEAIDRIRGGSPVYNAVFMDHMMPGMDGIEATDAIRALGTEYAKKIPIIALTANAIQGTDKMFYEHGFQAFITKPIDVVEMDSVIRKWVRDDKHEEVTVAEDSSASEDIVIKIPGVDTEKGLSLYAGETKVYLPMLRSYITNTPGVLEKLRNVSAENLPGYVITVHGLKGTSAGIGAEKIRETAFDLEEKSRAGDLQGVLEKNDKLIRDTEIIVANVKDWLEKNDAREAKPRQKVPDMELLARLRQCFESYDMNGIDKAMLELERYDYEEDAGLVAWLREKIETADFDAAAERITQYEDELKK